MKGYVKIFTYGCQMNDLDSLKMYSILSRNDWEPTVDTEQADIIILNTCSVRQKAYEKAMSNLGRLRKYKAGKPSLIIVFAGCVAQQEGLDIKARMPHVDIVLGTHQLHRINESILYVQEKKSTYVNTDFIDYISSMDVIPDKAFMVPGHRAYINIMQGCNNFCTYCIVPYVRGREISRDYKNILNEIDSHASSGVKEVFLLGQNVNSYNGGITFPELLKRINAIQGIERIRFTTSHPKDMSDSLIEAFGTLDKLCNHIHLPFQSGSNRVLKAMNRHYTRQSYFSLIERLRRSRPDMAFSADVMVGFPGETEDDYQQTIDLISEVRYDVLFSFKYSVRPGTKAAEWPDDISTEDKKQRLARLQDLQKTIMLENYQNRIGKIYDILVDGISSKHPDQVHGRTTQNTIVNFKGSPLLIGTTVKVCTTLANPNTFTGQMLK